MAVTVERLIATLEARFDKYERSLDRALGQTDRQFTRIERRGKAMEARMASIGAGIGRRFVGALIAGLSAREIARFADTAIKIENALKVTGLAGEDLARVYDSLRDSAMRNYAPLETLTTLYSRLGLAQKALGVSVDEMLNFTDKVALALRVQGTTAEEARGALIQLSQAMGAGIVRAEEYNSIVEGAPSILRAAAAGLKEAGGEVSKLRQLVIDGKLSSQAFFRAFEAGAPILDKMVETANVTLGQALTNLNNALVDTAKEFNDATGAANRFAGGINNIAGAIGDFDTAGFIRKIQEAGGALERFLNDVGNAPIFEDLAHSLGVLENGFQINLQTKAAREEAASLEREVKILQDRIALNAKLGFDNTEAMARLNEVSARLANLREQINGMPEYADMPGFDFGGPPSRRGKRRPKVSDPVSIKDFPVDPDSDKNRRKRENDYAREARQMEERIALLVAETEVQRQLNPLIDDYGYAVEKARAEQELLSAAKKAGLAITPALRSEIANLADQYALASAEAAKLAEEQDKARENAEKWLGVGQDVTKGFIDDLINGKSAAESFATAISKIGDALLDDVLSAIFDIKNASGGGFLGFLGSLFGGGTNWGALSASGKYLFDTGGYTGNGGKHEPKGVVHGGEYVFSKDAVRKAGVGNLEALHRSLKGYAMGGYVAPTTASMARPSAGPAGGESVIQVLLSPDLEARLLREAGNQSIQITQAGLRQFDLEAGPSMVKRVVNDPRAVG